MKVMKMIYKKPQLEVVKMVFIQHLLEHSGETDQPMSKKNDFLDESDDPLFEANQKNLWED